MVDDSPYHKRFFTGWKYCFFKCLSSWSHLSLWSQSPGSFLPPAEHSSQAYLLWSYASCIVWWMARLWVSERSIAISTLLMTKEKRGGVCIRLHFSWVFAWLNNTESTYGNRWMEISPFYLKPISRRKRVAPEMAAFNVGDPSRGSREQIQDKGGGYICVWWHTKGRRIQLSWEGGSPELYFLFVWTKWPVTVLKHFVLKSHLQTF